MMTTSERLERLESQFDMLAERISPKQEEINPNKDIIEKLNEFKSDILDYVSINRSGGECKEDLKEDDNPKFERNMWNYAIGGFLISAIITALTYKFILFFFPLAFSLFFAFSLISLGLLHDHFLLPGNTIRRIASNAIASSIFWLAFTIASVAGFAIGNSIISDPFGGEESHRNASVERHIEAAPTSESSKELRLGSGEAREE